MESLFQLNEVFDNGSPLTITYLRFDSKVPLTALSKADTILFT